MKTWHIKITLEDVDTKNIAIFDIDMNNSSAHFDLDNFDPDKWSDLFWETFVWILDMTWMKQKFMNTLESEME